MINAWEAAANLVKSVAMQVLLARERLESGVAYNPVSDEVATDPYAVYRRLRDRDPVHRMRLIDAWVLTRYEDADAMLRDHERFGAEDRRFYDTGLTTMLDLDPPDHTRLRALVSRAFTPRSVSRWHGCVREIADRLLDAVSGQDRFDLIAALGYPLPVTVIAEMLGVPADDMDRFEVWSNDIALIVEPILAPAQVEGVRRATGELFAYFETIVEARRREPRDDLVSALLAAEERGDRLTREELLSTMLLILVAGNETTRNLIGNGMLALLRHPDQLQRLRDQPDLLDPAVDELLRYDSPVQLDGRVVREDVEMGGRRLRAGQKVIALLGAANRDPAAFENPEALDIGRRERSHLSFGRGIHYCLGASLAVLEARIAFQSLLERFPSIRLAAEPRYRDGIVLRGVESLWIEVQQARQPAEIRDRSAP
ncbi:MAG: cytochrome P450 [Defluviicoccus sp.]|nr:cytochrome P450 [Defluviicoccus sp.]MDE0386828.1 cytochrome P450 [Defluviicoccus sp.]